MPHMPTNDEINNALFGPGISEHSIATRWDYDPNAVHAVTEPTREVPMRHERLSSPSWRSAPVVRFVLGLLVDSGVLASLKRRAS